MRSFSCSRPDSAVACADTIKREMSPAVLSAVVRVAVKTGHLTWAKSTCVRLADGGDGTREALLALASAADLDVRV